LLKSKKSKLGSNANSGYIGRFAPSPSGKLHFGSLVTALASYLDAKSHNGLWLVRIEDIDPPREEAGASQAIIDSLRYHGLHWDGELLYQSDRLDFYDAILERFKDDTYPCTCSRPRLLELRGIYDNHCLHKPPTINTETMHSTRVRLDRLSAQELSLAENYRDIFQGEQQQNLQKEVGDFILKRKDGLVAYQLAVVVDDIEQEITHIIRGSDLLSSTPRQRYLMLRLAHHLQRNIALPIYGHIPVATNTIGQKLSKQHGATPIEDSNAFDNICDALVFLNHTPPTEIVNAHNIEALLEWSVKHWKRSNIPQKMAIPRVD
jgi:glutamyl-Q tRNA(Asp) synthetase